MKMRGMDGDRRTGGRNRGRLRHQRREEGSQGKLKGLEHCVYADCVFGPIDKRPDMAVMRFTPGFVQRLKCGNIFKEVLEFEDGRRHKFAHYECCLDAGVRMETLSMEQCVLGCGGDFACFRHADLVDESGLYKPTKTPEWGCEPSGCLLIEHGWFEAQKGGLFSLFKPKHKAAVHWACAKAVWQWELLTGTFGEAPHGRSA